MMRIPAPDRVVLAPEERRRALLDVIESAQEHLLVSVFRCDDRQIVHALTAACRRKVRVEALVTGRAKGPKANLRILELMLEQIGVRVWRYGDRSRKYHGKYIVADGRVAVVGSVNLTKKCFRSTSDFLVVSQDVKLARGLTALFEADCRLRATPPMKELASRLIVGPDESRARITRLLNGARRSIRIIDPKLADDAMIDLLTRKAAGGVEVRILDGRRVAGLRSHGRLLIIDAHTAVVGSMALATRHLDHRREVAVVVDHPKTVDPLVYHFDDAARGRSGSRISLVAQSVA
jgi:phosphatidylserine/phosphatidylglycerophosphate/cardiolipin synthase-like enzyme